MNSSTIKTYSENLSKIKTQLTRNKVAELYSTYNSEDDGHLAKILTLRGIEI
jgi:hypothetical protein